MSIRKKILASIIGLVFIVLFVYGLYLMGGTVNRAGEGGLQAPGPRTLITLVIWGGSAFITGFGLRDAVGRVAAARLRNRSKAAQGTGNH